MFVLLDDIIVLGHSFEAHIQNLDSVFQRLREAGLRLKPDMCAIFREEVSYLGHIISRGGVAADPAKLIKVANWPVPTSVREVQQFIGFAGYYCRFGANRTTLVSFHRAKKGVERSRAWLDKYVRALFAELARCVTDYIFAKKTFAIR